jgi:glycosyltransferase involved in cell wall biosynthesis
MNNPKVSICIPTYNQPDFLKIVLDSIVIQKFNDYEVIISDDSTNDDSERLVKTYANKIQNINYFRNTPSKKSPASWNEAIRNAKGEYIKVMHSDDWFSGPDALQIFVEALDNNPKSNFAFSASNVCDTKQKTKYIHEVSKKELLKLKKSPTYLFGRNIIGAPSATIYRKLVTNKYYDEKTKWVVDLDQYISILQENNNLEYIPKPLVCTTDGASHQSNNSSVGIVEVELFEWLYLYAKFRKTYPKIKYRAFILLYIMFILSKCNVSDLSQVKNLNIEKEERDLVKTLLRFKALFMVFKVRNLIFKMINRQYEKK